MDTALPWKVVPLTGALGAEIEGIDLSQPLGRNAVAFIRRSLLEHLVVFFRDQPLTVEQHKEFARQFGDLHIHPITVPMQGHPEVIAVVKEASETNNWGDGWHSDLVALPAPPLGSILYAKDVPAFCGDTHFQNMVLAFDTLSPVMREFIAGLRCFHWQSVRAYSGHQSMRNMENAVESEAEHPLAPVHPETGRRSLLLPRQGFGRIVGLNADESDTLIDMLRRHAENGDFACRFRWRPHSVAFWDNRCTQHRVTADYFYAQRDIAPQRRVMHRVTITGSPPC